MEKFTYEFWANDPNGKGGFIREVEVEAENLDQADRIVAEQKPDDATVFLTGFSK